MEIMTEKKERRYIERRVLSDALVYYRRNGWVNFGRPFQGPLQLIDISKSAMRVEGDLSAEKYNRLQLKIHIPGRGNIFIKAKVSAIDVENTQTIMQVLAFGYGEQYNSFHTKARWELLFDASLAGLHMPERRIGKNPLAVLDSLIRILNSLV